MQSQQHENQQYEQQIVQRYQSGYPTIEPPVADYPRQMGESTLERPSHYPQPPMYRQGQSELFATPLPHTDERFIAALTYSMGWFSGLLFVLFARNRYVRFHALQSLLFFGGINLLDVGLFSIVSFTHHFWSFSFILVLAILLLNVIAFVGWVVGMFQSYRGTYYQMPIVGALGASIIQPNGGVKN